jgi:outer membrane lipoprotein-sorting protein
MGVRTRSLRDRGHRVLGGLWLILLSASGVRAEEPREILAESLKPRDTTYAGVQVSEVMGPLGAKRAQRQRVFRRDNTLRIEYPGGGVLYDDGQQQLLFLPKLNVVEKGPSRLNTAAMSQARRALLRGKVTVETLPDSTLLGRPTYVVSVRPPRGNPRKVWIDKQTYLQLRLEETKPNGRTVATYFERIDFDADPPATRLAFTPPPGAEVVERGQRRPISEQEAAQLARAWGGLLKPRFMAPGYRLRGYFRHQYGGQPALVAVYAPLGRGPTLSMFQRPAMGMAGAAMPKAANLQVVTARKGEANVTVVGPLPEEELKRIMDSVVP